MVEETKMFDLVIRDAEIFDGTGSAPVRGDLGVTSGRARRHPARQKRARHQSGKDVAEHG